MKYKRVEDIEIGDVVMIDYQWWIVMSKPHDISGSYTITVNAWGSRNLEFHEKSLRIMEQ